MAWSDQCKISFAVTVRAKQYQGEKQRSTNAIIKEISKESGIPAPTLWRWWEQTESSRTLIKNDKDNPTHQERSENKVDQKPEVDQRPSCQCGRPAKPGKIKADGTRSYYGQCQKCLRTATTAVPSPSKRSADTGQKGDIVSEDFEKAYEAFYRQVQNAKLEKWANTSKKTCSKMVKWINDLIEV